jgi:hypothetical protein
MLMFLPVIFATTLTMMVVVIMSMSAALEVLLHEVFTHLF